MAKKVTKTGLASEAKVAEKTYNISKGSVGKNVKGSTLLNKYSPSALKRFISTAGGVVTILKAAPGPLKVGALLAALAATGYELGKYNKWKDKRDGKTGNIGTPKPKDTGPKALRAKPDPVKRAADRTQDYQKKAHGGKVHTKAYAHGGGIRKAKTYG